MIFVKLVQLFDYVCRHVAPIKQWRTQDLEVEVFIQGKYNAALKFGISSQNFYTIEIESVYTRGPLRGLKISRLTKISTFYRDWLSSLN